MFSKFGLQEAKRHFKQTKRQENIDLLVLLIILNKMVQIACDRSAMAQNPERKAVITATCFQFRVPAPMAAPATPPATRAFTCFKKDLLTNKISATHHANHKLKGLEQGSVP